MFEGSRFGMLIEVILVVWLPPFSLLCIRRNRSAFGRGMVATLFCEIALLSRLRLH